MGLEIRTATIHTPCPDHLKDVQLAPDRLPPEYVEHAEAGNPFAQLRLYTEYPDDLFGCYCLTLEYMRIWRRSI